MDNKSESAPNVKEPTNFPGQQIRQESAQVAETKIKDKATHKSAEELKKDERRNARVFTEAGKDEDNSPICSIFDHLQELCNSPEFDMIHEDMNTCFPNFKEDIQQGKADLSRKDLCVIIAGETSAGKSTLINRLINKNIFMPNVEESTATICRIRNSGKENEINCRVFGASNQVIEEKTFFEESVESVQKYLQEYVDKRQNRDSINIDHVDVSLSVPFLKGNTMIVDSPGIGATSDLEEKMMNYLPNATSFVFVMNVGNAGGVQKDRLLKIIKEVMRVHDEDDIPCFDPQDALFVSNKWDTVHKDESQRAWERIQEKLKEYWPSLTPENVFQTALRPASGDIISVYEEEYKRFEKCLSDVIEKNQYARRIKRIRFLEDIAKEMDVRVKGRLHVISMSGEICDRKIKNLNSEVLRLAENTTQKEQELNDMISQEFEKLNESLLKFLWSIDGKNRILNPPNKKPIISVSYHELGKKVEKRINDYVIEWKRGAEVAMTIKSIVNRITVSFSEIQHKIQEIESEVKGSLKENQRKHHQQSDFPTPLLIGAAASAPLWIPILASVGTLYAVAGFVFSPVLVFKIKQWRSEEKKSKIINGAYDEITTQYTTGRIIHELEDMYGSHYRKLVKRLFAETADKQIQNLIVTITNLQKKRSICFGRAKDLELLQEKIEDIKRLSSVEMKRNSCVHIR